MWRNAHNILKRKHQKLFLLVAVILLIVAFFPFEPAKAGWFDLDVGSAVNGIILSFLTWVIGALGSVLAFVAGFLDSVLSFSKNSIGDAPSAVKSSWVIIRDFANLFFILALIIMAFGTIFNIKNYTWSTMLVPFLIAALLINFSFAIGSYIVSVADGISGVFLKQMGTVSTRLASGFSLGKAITFDGKAIADGSFVTSSVIMKSGMALAFIIVFVAIALMAMLSALVFVLIRIPVIWLLLIVSPLAWIGSVFPGLKKETWDQWWKYFNAWTWFPPIYLFFLSFSFIFISQKPAMDNKIELKGSTASILSGIFSLNDLFFYGITLMFMLGGLAMSLKLGFTSSTYITGKNGLFDKIQSGIKGGARKVTGYDTIKAGVQQGINAKKEEIKEKGVFGFGSAQSARLRQAAIAGIFDKGAVYDKQRSEEISKEYGKLKTQNLDKDTLAARLVGAKGVEKDAMMQMNAENGWETSAASVSAHLKELGGSHTRSGSAYLKALEKNIDKIFTSTAAKETIAGDVNTDVGLRKTLYKSIADNGEKVNSAVMEQALALYGGEAQDVQNKVAESFKKSIKKLDVGDRADALLHSANSKLREMTAEVMRDEKEINTMEKMEAAITALGGMGSVKGADMEKEAKKGNLRLREEEKYRIAAGWVRGMPLPALSDVDRSRLTDQINVELKNMPLAELRTLTAGEILSPEVRTAINNGGFTVAQVKAIKYSGDRKRRDAARDAELAPSPEFAYTP